MKKLFRWFALSLLVGAMFTSLWGMQASANEDDSTTCGSAGWASTTVSVLSHCTSCSPGFGPDVSVGPARVLVCQKP